MSERPNNNKPKINVPRPNLTWLYIVIALVFGFLYFTGCPITSLNFMSTKYAIWCKNTENRRNKRKK